MFADTFPRVSVRAMCLSGYAFICVSLGQAAPACGKDESVSESFKRGYKYPLAGLAVQQLHNMSSELGRGFRQTCAEDEGLVLQTQLSELREQQSSMLKHMEHVKNKIVKLETGLKGNISLKTPTPHHKRDPANPRWDKSSPAANSSSSQRKAPQMPTAQPPQQSPQQFQPPRPQQPFQQQPPPQQQQLSQHLLQQMQPSLPPVRPVPGRSEGHWNTPDNSAPNQRQQLVGTAIAPLRPAPPPPGPSSPPVQHRARACQMVLRFDASALICTEHDALLSSRATPKSEQAASTTLFTEDFTQGTLITSALRLQHSSFALGINREKGRTFRVLNFTR
eukprot:803278-Pleurochrysis_carterae.AAC.2